MEGFLTKRGKIVKSWKVRWFCLEKGELVYYVDQTKTKIKGQFQISATTVVDKPVDQGDRRFMMLIKNFSHDQGLLISAENAKTRDQWIEAIGNCVAQLVKQQKADEEYAAMIQNRGKRNSADRAVSSVPLSPRTVSTDRSAPLSKVNVTPPDKKSGESKLQPPQTAQTVKPPPVPKPEVKKESSRRSMDDMSLLPRLTEIRSAQDLNQLKKAAKPPTEVRSSVSEFQKSINRRSSSMMSSRFRFSVRLTEDECESVEELDAEEDEGATCPIGENQNQQHLQQPQPSGGEDAQADYDSNWVEVKTADGRSYYYHKVSRVTRCEKPERHIMEAMEARLRENQAATEKHTKDRLAELEKQQHLQEEREEAMTATKIEIDQLTKKWRRNARGTDKTFPEMLQSLAIVLPDDMLMEIYSSTNKIVFDSLLGLTIQSNPSEVKKIYMKVVRFIHPDKLSPTLEMRSKLLAEQIFIILTEKFDLYRAAHEL